IQLLVLAGAVSAIASALFGWLLATNEGVAGLTLDLHQWIGFATAGLGAILLYLLGSGKLKSNPTKLKSYRLVLFLSGIGVGLAGHFGASLTHGEDFLTEVLPWNQ